jgi:glycolate oxidase
VSAPYAPVTPEIARQVAAIVGDRQVIYAAPDRLEPYGHDESVDESGACHLPELVVRPGSAADIQALVRLANRENVPITPRGAGSGLSGGAVPLFGGIVLDVGRLNRILEIDTENLMIVVEPGVITSEINEKLRPHRLFYAGYPMSLESCCIGGNVAENAGGGKAVKYGVTGRYVTGLDVVAPNGDLLCLGGKLVKDVTGLNLLQLMVGSEGTLGIFTRIILKLLPLPVASVDLLCLFRSAREAIGAVPRIMTGTGIIPTAIEFMDQTSVRASCSYLNESIPYEQAGAMLLITVDGTDQGQVERDYERIGEACEAAGAFEVYVADNRTTSERLWRIRRNIAEAFKLISPHQSLEDIVVPMAAIPAMVEAVEKLSVAYDVPIPCYGHAGDGNLHATPVMNPAWSSERWRTTLPVLLTDLYRQTARLGGRLSGEHGIGCKRKAYMHLVVDEGSLNMMRAIKHALDPNAIMNPGKIVDQLAPSAPPAP